MIPPMGFRSSTIARFAYGFSLPLRGASLLMRRRRLKRFAILPLIANAVLYVIVLAVAVWFIGSWDPQVGEWQFWGPVGGWLSTAVNWSAGPLKWLVAIPLLLAFCWFTFQVVGMIVASPFNDILSERVERTLCFPKEQLDVPLRLTAANAVVGVLDSTKIVALQVVATILVLPLLFVPVVGAVPLLLVTAYFAGLGFFDVSMARNDLRYRHKRAKISDIRAELFGLGVAMELLFLIPFMGLLMLPVGVTAGTMLYCGIDWEAHFERRGITPPRTWQAPVIATAEALPESA